MSNDLYDAVVAEYLREVEQRLHGLPVLQRRELLGDLEAHIATERAERGISSETELLHVLERLGTPAVVAAAAYEEAGLPLPPVPAASVGSASGSGSVTFAASSRFTGRAERTAPIVGTPVPAYVPPAPAPVIPPPDDPPVGRRGPFPPNGPGRPGGFVPPPGPRRTSGFGPPMPPTSGRSGGFGPQAPGRPGGFGSPAGFGSPVPGSRPGSTAWVRVLIAGAVLLAAIVALGCLAGAFLFRGAESDSVSPAVPAQPIASIGPADPPTLPPLPTP
ncbi:hypothetical protein AB0M36_26160 [Actinoplanes sp. NPDC051346]|uniref:HAAS signaling domain-containing protein n=1 Tax=Actinoplanes sp. NPDC051346 TaxID=3155048 RepID=UPI00343169A1